MTTDFEKSFKARLRNIAKETNRNPADLWQSLVLERFLVRLGLSPYRNHFVLKGGVLLARYLPIGRETQDLDFLGVSMPNDKENLKQTFSEIARIDTGDNFLFKDVSIAGLVHPHMAYAGVEVSMTAHFGRTRFPVLIDIGFGDKVEPVDKQITLTSSSKGPLFEKSLSLLCYLPEFIFAEKLETLVSRGGTNSRMKDFHDLYTMLRKANLSYDTLKKAILFVFEHRQTHFTFPLEFSDNDLSLLQSQWAKYCARLHYGEAQDLPFNVSDCVNSLNDRLVTIL